MSRQPAIGERLTQEAGLLAGRLLRFLDVLLERHQNAADARRFLQFAYESATSGRPLESWRGGILDRRPAGEPHPVDRLATALHLKPVEVDVLLLAGMAEAHEGYAAVFRTLTPRGDPRPSAGLAAQLFCTNPSERQDFYELLEDGALVRSGALRVEGEGPFFERSLIPAEKLWPVLYGLDVWPAAVECVQMRPVLAGLDEWFAGRDAARAITALRSSEPCTIFLTGDSEETAFRRGIALAARAGSRAAAIVLRRDLDPDAAHLIRIHTLARGVTPVLRLPEPEGPAVPAAPVWEDYPSSYLVCGRSGACRASGNRPLLHVAVERLPAPARVRMWREMLPKLLSHASQLAARYPVEPSVAAEIASDLACMARLDNRTPALEDVSRASRSRAGLSLSAGIELIRPSATWEDLVLSPDRLEQLREAVSRVRCQARVLDDWGFLKGRAGARGVRMLFSGPPGTGKTLSAEVLAGALGTDLLFVDISRVVSKWIGETEKTLASIFDCAERAQAVLFFDEADALFGKRTEVSDAHDRYANLETAFMLSRLERFEGLSVLATNLRQNIDPAFLRRIEFAVDFDEPDRAERAALWRCHIPERAPVAPDVDLGEFAARYPIVGGLIRNAAVAAGYLAASDGGTITRNHLVHALRREYEKAGRAFPGGPAVQLSR